MIEIQVRPYYRKKTNPRLVQQWAEAVLSFEKKTGNATIVITGNREIHAYNKEYRQIDSPTDVLSFTDGNTDPETGELYLGDILISWMKANQQAIVENHPLEAELALLTVHGMLHLLGYDHHTDSDRKKMWKRQAAILTAIGFDMNLFSELEETDT